MNTTNMQNAAKWVLLALALLLAMNSLAFIQQNAVAHLMADQWRHMKTILLPYLSGEADLSVLWANHHSRPLYHLQQLLNMEYFGFDARLDGYIGLAARVGIAVLLVRMLRNAGVFARPSWVAFALLAASATILFGFNSRSAFWWPLVGTQSTIHLFILVLFLTVDAQVRAGSGTLLRGLAAIGASLLVMFASADLGLIFLVPLLLLLAIMGVVERRRDLLLLMLALLVVGLGYRYAVSLTGHAGPGASAIAREGGEASAATLVELTTAMALGMLSGFVPTFEIHQAYPGLDGVQKFFGVLILVATLGVGISYLLQRLWRVSIVPVLLVGGWVLYCVAIILFRAKSPESAEWVVTTDRYGLTHSFGALGLIWAAWLVATRRQEQSRRVLPAAAVAIVLGLSVTGVQLAQAYSAWRMGPSLRALSDRNKLGIYLQAHAEENSIYLPRSVVGKNRESAAVTAFLRDHSLNVFAPDFERGPLLEAHLRWRQVYTDSADPVCTAVPIRSANIHPACAGSMRLADGGVTFYGPAQAVRLALASAAYVPKGLRIKRRGKTLVYDIYEGTQVYYFGHEDGEQMSIGFIDSGVTGAVDVRRNGGPQVDAKN